MSARALLSKLRGRGVEISAEEDRLTIDAPAGAITDEIRTTLVENKPGLLELLIWERRKLEEATQRGLVIKWSGEPGWISLHDPATGEWHEVRAPECLPGVVEAANRHRRRKKGGAA